MLSPRARWLAARTRNAARHGLLIAASGVIVMIAALLTFVLLPRQADRALGAALSQLPRSRDTVALQARRRAAADSLAAVTARRTAIRATMGSAAMMAAAAALPTADSTTVLGAAPAGRADTAVLALQQQIARARQTPLVESYRSLADASLLRRSERTRGVVSALLDSIEQLNREREAYAALSGPDARYATMTARLTSLGNRLVQVAQRTAASSMPTPRPAPPVTSAGDVPPLFTDDVMRDSLLDTAVRDAARQLSTADSALAAARAFNDSLTARKETLRTRMQLSIPPVAMLLASLILGLVAGFSVALLRELRQPTVGDAQELETLTHSRVIVYDREDGTRQERQLRRGEVAVPVLSPSADAWPLLHLTLSHIGDMARHVQVLADRPVLAGAVGLNLAAVAARESRATALVDAAERAGSLIPLLPVGVIGLSSAPGSHSGFPSGARPGETDDAWDFSREVPLGRDASVSLVLPRRARYHRRRPANDSATLGTADEARRALAPRLRHFDFVVFVTDSPQPAVLPAESDVVLCARLGVTPLAWLANAVRQADDRGRRIRAVVLWERDVPLAG